MQPETHHILKCVTRGFFAQRKLRVSRVASDCVSDYEAVKKFDMTREGKIRKSDLVDEMKQQTTQGLASPPCLCPLRHFQGLIQFQGANPKSTHPHPHPSPNCRIGHSQSVAQGKIR